MLRSTPVLVVTALSLSLGVGACAKKPAGPRWTRPPAPWVSLFDGKDLDGWKVKIAGHDGQ